MRYRKGVNERKIRYAGRLIIEKKRERESEGRVEGENLVARFQHQKHTPLGGYTRKRRRCFWGTRGERKENENIINENYIVFSFEREQNTQVLLGTTPLCMMMMNNDRTNQRRRTTTRQAHRRKMISLLLASSLFALLLCVVV